MYKEISKENILGKLSEDLQEVEPIAGVEIYQLDFLSHDALCTKIKNLLGGKATVVLSDMAAPSSGQQKNGSSENYGSL